MNPNCYHLHGPSGVKLATERIRKVLREQNPQYIIRADIRSFYKSIPHFRLIQDIKQHYDDPKIQNMLEQIIINPIETPRGYKNPDQGIALHGPLSQFFSGLYLKPLDDAYAAMDVTYIRYQDDLLILCQTRRQLERCKQRMMAVLKERRLRLSHKKTRMGSIEKGFHFLGIQYPGTQPLNNTNVTQTIDKAAIQIDTGYIKTSLNRGGASISKINQSLEPDRIIPHAWTLRKARDQIKQMVIDEVSPRQIRRYLHHWATWWVRTTTWQYHELLEWFLQAYWDFNPAAYAAGLLHHSITENFQEMVPTVQDFFATV